MNKKLLFLILSLMFLLSAPSIFAETINTSKQPSYQQTITDIPVGTAQEYYNRGNIYGKKGNLTQAISDYTKAIEINPIFTEAYYNRGNTYEKQGNLTQAISDYTKAIETNPKYAAAYCNRGNVYQTQGNLPLAIADYNKALEISPNDSTSLYNRGLAYYGAEQYGKALTDYTTAISQNPDKEAYEDFIKNVPAKKTSDIKNVRNEILQLFVEKLNLDKKTAIAAAAPTPVVAVEPAPIAAAEPAPVIPAEPIPAPAAVANAPVVTTENLAPVDIKQNETKSIPEEAVQNLVTKWLTSWKSGDMKTYRSCYASNFQSKGMNLDAWISYKNNVRQRSKNINISIDDLQISVDENSAMAVFTQSYSSSMLKDKGKKTLELKKINDEWKIYSEIM
jgi:tetratricopeptide (TPR) repeat protein